MTEPIGTYTKAAAAIKDYPISWAPYLESDETVVSASYSVSPAGLTVGVGAYAPTIDDNGKGVVVWLQGGTPGVSYEVTCHVSTSNTPPRVDDRTILITIEGAAGGDALPLSYYNVLDYGADPTGVDDSTLAIQTAIAACQAAFGGIVFFPRGTYRTTDEILVNGDSVCLLGVGSHSSGSVILMDASSNVDGIRIAQCQGSGVRHMRVASLRVYTDKSGVFLDRTYKCFLDDVWCNETYNGISVLAVETWITNIQLRGIFGRYGVVLYGLDLANYSHALWWHGGTCDCPYPLGQVGVAAAWAPTTGYVAGNVARNGSGIFQCSTPGTSAGAGGPTGPATSVVATARSTPIVDGTAEWLFVCHASLEWMAQREYCNTLSLSGHISLINGYQGLTMFDAVVAAGSTPAIVIASQLEIDHPYEYGIQLFHGYDVSLDNSWISSVLAGDGVRIGGNFSHQWRINDTRIFGGGRNGVSVARGHGMITNCAIGHASGLAANSYDGVNVDGGVGNLVIVGNRIGELEAGTGNPMRYGVHLNAGAGNNIVVRDNDLTGNDTGGVLNNATGASVDIGNNLGDNDFAHARQTGQTASIGATDLFPSTPRRGRYLVGVRLQVTTAGAAGTVFATIGFSDDIGATSHVTATINLNAQNRTHEVFFIETTGSAQVTYSTTVAGAAGGPEYSVSVEVQRLSP